MLYGSFIYTNIQEIFLDYNMKLKERSFVKVEEN